MPRPRPALTLWPDAIPADKIPDPPAVVLRRAVEGDTTYRITSEHQLSKYRWSVTVDEFDATPGELLRGPDLQYMPDYNENLRYRYRVYQTAEGSPHLQDLQRKLCKSSILYYIATYGWTYDPRRESGEKDIPFIPFDYQKDVLTWMVGTLRMREEGLVEKSRAMGMTWLFVMLVDWLSTFYEGNTSYLTSLREEDVDNRQPDSLFGKLRHHHSRLPEWMNAGWKRWDMDVDKLLNINFPETGAFIRGQKVESTAGRQGRATVVGADEFAHITSGAEVLDAFTGLAPTIFYFSTPKGMGNAFAMMAHRPGVNKLTLHWTQHPFLNHDWAKKESSKPKYFDDASWAQEFEIDYAGSVSARVFSQFTWAPGPGVEWVHARDDDTVRFDPSYDVDVFIDLGGNDPCSLLFAQTRPIPPEYHHLTPLRYTLSIFAEYEGVDMTAYCLRFLLNREAAERGYRYRHIVVDMRTGEQKDSSGRTWLINLADPDVKAHQSTHFGEMIIPGPPIHVVGNRPYEEEAFDQVRTLLGQVGGLAVNKEACQHAVQVLQNWSYPVDKVTRRKLPGAPANHDQWSHAGKALCYGVDWAHSKHLQRRRPKKRGDRDGWNFSKKQARFM